MTDFVLLKSIFRTILLIIQFKIHEVNLILADGISAFHSSEIKHGGVTGGGVTYTGGRAEGVAGCEGKMVVTPSFKRGSIE